MASYELETRLGSDAVLKRAEAFFGESGLGLAQRDDSPHGCTWQGGGGSVFLTVSNVERGSRVEIATTE